MYLIAFGIITRVARNYHRLCYSWMHKVPMTPLTTAIDEPRSFQIAYEFSHLWRHAGSLLASDDIISGIESPIPELPKWISAHYPK